VATEDKRWTKQPKNESGTAPMSFGNCKDVPTVASRNIGTRQCRKFIRTRRRPTRELLPTHRMYNPHWEIRTRERNNLKIGQVRVQNNKFLVRALTVTPQRGRSFSAEQLRWTPENRRARNGERARGSNDDASTGGGCRSGAVHTDAGLCEPFRETSLNSDKLPIPLDPGRRGGLPPLK
jgi:hypothetical protein